MRDKDVRRKQRTGWTAAIFGILFLLGVTHLSEEASAAGLYHIGVGDTLSITVWEEPKLNGVFSVLPDGMITMPLLGTFRAAGYTSESLSRHIARRMSAIFRKAPSVTVTIKGMGNNFFYISGAVGKPGVVPFTHNIRLLQAIILAGGATMAAKEDSVVLIRDNKPRTLSIEKLDQGKDLSQNVRILPQDIIIVPVKTEQIYLMGEVAGPGAYYYNKGMTVMQALIQAHGFTQFASLGSVRIIRKQKDGTKKIVHIDINHIENEKKTEAKEYLKPGDLIYVPQRMF
ncbi:SLBB domain-containing protein [Leptospirillum ferriphilum]|jgi:polysaccharide export outer membrane protein|uniref:SLBB domain-containing protein n=1 Tax=Leptospirillum ferriphilum TaxID=178606 RepID=UPI003EE6F90C